MREGDGMTGVDPQKIEVRKYGHNVPLADGTCQNCGGATKFNLAVGIVAHVDGIGSGRIVCRDPWPAVRPVEALAGIGVSATIQEAPQRASGDRGVRVDGSGASVSVAATLRAAAEGRREYANGYGREPEFDDVVAMLRLQADTLDAAALVAEGNLGPLYGWLPSWRWTDEMVAKLHDRPMPPAVELGQEVDCCARAAGRHTRGGPDHCGLCGKPFDTPLPPAGNEMREHPGTGQPTEGVAGEVSRG
jgi:hypothetical protein